MKILITSIVDPKKSQHNRVHQFIKHLSKKHDITVLSINDWWKGKQGDLRAYSKEFEERGGSIKYFYFTDKRISPVLQELFCRKKVKEVLQREDFDVHLNYSTLISGYYVAKKIKTVYDIADDLGAMIKESPQIPWLLRPFGGVLGDSMLRKNIEIAQKVAVTTDILKRTYNIPDAKCEIIPNGVDTDLFRNHGNTKKEIGLDGFIIGYVGVLREWVDLESMFQILKNLDDEIKMAVVGQEGNFMRNIELAKKYGISNRVTFMGMLPYSQVPKYISAMDICLIPFKAGVISENALPLKLFEYMACEKPVISSKIPGVQKAASDIVLYASSLQDYERHIRVLYKNEKERKERGRKGRKLVEEKYDWKGIVDKLEEILIECRRF